MDVTVIVSTFGNEAWIDLARTRAIPSAEQAGAPVVHSHGPSLHEARNRGAATCSTEWLAFLDADDELDPRYFDAMERGTADVRAPMALYIEKGRERLWQPRVAGHKHDCTADCLTDGNWMLVGSCVRRELFEKAGGWHDYPWSEDWSTWIRCWKAGGTFELVRDAIYRAHVRRDSRNRGATRKAKDEAHWQIHRAEFPELYEEAA